ncbi:hypothetical protein WA026_023672 [Henosepilachna vigintioctopunctata]|uniref:Uncharacterized protein n=1 Tax=Henosepilachna vigintioctopunctata TaxID=420089 RepID=A0AAW1U839_9CUCU
MQVADVCLWCIMKLQHQIFLTTKWTILMSYPTKNTASPLLALCVTDTSNKNRSNTFVSPEVIRPYPKAGPRKSVRTGRKKGRTSILTDTQEKLAIESELEARKRKRRKLRKLKQK